MPLTYTDNEVKTLTINTFETLADYQAALQAEQIGTNELCFIDEVYQVDWEQDDNTAPDYIKNKPTPPTVYVGTETPSANIGTDGDIFIITA